MSTVQGNRIIRLSTPLGEDQLLPEQMVGQEQLGRLFEYELRAYSDDFDLTGEGLLGENVTLSLDIDAETERFFNGIVSSFRLLPTTADLQLARYELTLHPWLWLLTRTSDCRIFQNMTVEQIVKDIFAAHNASDFRFDLHSSYRTWEYCVQYRESDFNFISRLLEHEGIYYYFEHENGKHTMVLADGYSSHNTVANYETVPYYPPQTGSVRERDHLSQWSFAQTIQPTAVELNSFEFKKPKGSLISRRNIEGEHGTHVIYDYAGDYYNTADGDKYAQVRLDQMQSSAEVLRGGGDARGLTTGALFSLEKHPRQDVNAEYLITSASYELYSNPFRSSAADERPPYQCTIEVIRASQNYRPARTTPVPEIKGPQSAIVVGQSGEEIFTEQYGQVKVSFPWDRYSQSDENSSCWIRVMHPIAGQKYGTISLPRIGQEVIVEFLEADPNRPIITGSVFNEDTKVPYPLPANKTISTTKTNSSKGGNGFNEIRLEDKKGEEQIYIHGEKDLDINIKNDRVEAIGNDHHLTVVNDKVEHVENNRHETVDAHHKELVKGDRNLEVGGKQASYVKDSLSITVDKDVAEKFNKNHSQVITDDSYVKASNIVIEATQNITLKVGKSYIAIDATGIKLSTVGDIELDAKKTIKQKAALTFDVEGGVSLGAKSPMTSINGDATLVLKGGLITIN